MSTRFSIDSHTISPQNKYQISMIKLCSERTTNNSTYTINKYANKKNIVSPEAEAKKLDQIIQSYKLIIQNQLKSDLGLSAGFSTSHHIKP